MDNILPAVKFPTTLVIVDDNAQFLNNFKLVLGGDFKYQAFTSAKEALEFIKNQEIALNETIKKYFSSTIEDDRAPQPIINFDIPVLHHLIFDPNRFSLSAVMVTDYAMPDMNGLTLCEQIKNRLIKVILLTGEAGFDLAVKGFNEGIIDQFVLKSEMNFYEKVKEYAQNLQIKLFSNISKSLVDAISGKEKTIFTDPVFIEFFNKTVEKHNIVEYYLLDDSGSYLLADAQGQIFWLAVKNEEDMRMLYELAEDEGDVSPEVMTALKNKKILAFFPTKAHEFRFAKDWQFEEAERLEGENDVYYHSLVVGTDNHYTLKEKNILSYADYLKNMEK